MVQNRNNQLFGDLVFTIRFRNSVQTLKNETANPHKNCQVKRLLNLYYSQNTERIYTILNLND